MYKDNDTSNNKKSLSLLSSHELLITFCRMIQFCWIFIHILITHIFFCVTPLLLLLRIKEAIKIIQKSKHCVLSKQISSSLHKKSIIHKSHRCSARLTMTTVLVIEKNVFVQQCKLYLRHFLCDTYARKTLTFKIFKFFIQFHSRFRDWDKNTDISCQLCDFTSLDILIYLSFSINFTSFSYRLQYFHRNLTGLLFLRHEIK